MMKQGWIFLACLGLAGCAEPLPPDPPEIPLEGTITLASGPCTALCAVYRMQVNADDTYELNAEENTITPGRTRGALPVNSFRRALEALDEFRFQSFERFYTETEADNCPEYISGLPTVDISRLGVEEERHLLTYDTGCLGFASRDRLDRLHQRLRDIFRVRVLIAVGEPPKAEDVKPQ